MSTSCIFTFQGRNIDVIGVASSETLQARLKKTMKTFKKKVGNNQATVNEVLDTIGAITVKMYGGNLRILVSAFIHLVSSKK
jgi:hypothetical protein